MPRRDQMKGRLDTDSLFAALEAARKDRDLTWFKVAKQTGVSQSTLTRLSQGRRPDVDGTLALTRWLGLSLEHFERDSAGSPVRSEPITEVVALLRALKKLSPKSREMLARLVTSAYEELKEE